MYMIPSLLFLPTFRAFCTFYPPYLVIPPPPDALSSSQSAVVCYCLPPPSHCPLYTPSFLHIFPLPPLRPLSYPPPPRHPLIVIIQSPSAAFFANASAASFPRMPMSAFTHPSLTSPPSYLISAAMLTTFCRCRDLALPVLPAFLTAAMAAFESARIKTFCSRSR